MNRFIKRLFHVLFVMYILFASEVALTFQVDVNFVLVKIFYYFFFYECSVECIISTSYSDTFISLCALIERGTTTLMF